MPHHPRAKFRPGTQKARLRGRNRDPQLFRHVYHRKFLNIAEKHDGELSAILAFQSERRSIGKLGDTFGNVIFSRPVSFSHKVDILGNLLLV